MARHGENIYLRKDGRYEGRYVIGQRPNGKTAFGYIYGKKYSDVKKRLLIAKGEYASGQKTAITVYSDGSTASWLHLWLADYIGPTIKKSTLGIYRRQVEKYMIPNIGHIKLREICKDTLRLLYLAIQEQGGTLHTAQTICRRFRCALLIAQEEGFIASVPALPFKKTPMLKKEPRFLSKSEQKKLENSLILDTPKDIAILLGLYTGIRIGECCALKWENIDFKEHHINILHSYQRITISDEDSKTGLLYTIPKSECGIRKIPMTKTLEMALTHLKSKSNALESGFVFGTSLKPVEPRVLQYHMKNIEQRSQLEGIHYHTLRHTFATRCLEMQFDIKTLSELLGHSSAQITLDWYCHSSMNRKKLLMQKLNNPAA